MNPHDRHLIPGDDGGDIVAVLIATICGLAIVGAVVLFRAAVGLVIG